MGRVGEMLEGRKDVQHRGLAGDPSLHYYCDCHLFIDVPASHIGSWAPLYILALHLLFVYCAVFSKLWIKALIEILEILEYFPFSLISLDLFLFLFSLIPFLSFRLFWALAVVAFRSCIITKCSWSASLSSLLRSFILVVSTFSFVFFAGMHLYALCTAV